MKRGKGICAFALIVAMSVPVLGTGGASGDPGGGRGGSGGSSGGVTAAQSSPAQNSAAQSSADRGGGRGGGSGGSGGAGGAGGAGGSSGSSSASSSSDPGSSASSGATATPSSSGGSAGGNPTGGTGGRGGSGSNPTDSGAGRGSGNGSASPAGSSQSQSSGQQGRGGNGGSGQTGSSNSECGTGCHVGQQPGTSGTPTFTPAPAGAGAVGATVAPAATSTTPASTTPTTTQLKGTPPRIVPPSRFPSKSKPLAKRRRPSGATRAGTTGSTTSAGGVRAPITLASAGALGGLLGRGPVNATATQSATDTHAGKKDTAKPVMAPVGVPSPILHFVKFVPLAIWIALGAAVAFAGVAGAAALWSSHRVRRQAGQFAAMSEAAMTDALTGILNRRGFIAAADRELARARRHERPFVLAYIDVRGLKAVNDSEGHGAGDQLLQTVARLLAESARADDVVGRLGGDEMGLLLAEQGPEGAAVVTKRIATEVAVRREALGLQSRWDLTIGTASYPADGETIDDLLRVADAHLYEQRGIEIREGVATGMPAPR